MDRREDEDGGPAAWAAETLAEDEARIATLRTIAAEGRACMERGEFTAIDGEEAARAFLARQNAGVAELAKEPSDAGDRG